MGIPFTHLTPRAGAGPLVAMICRYGAGPTATACWARRWNSSPRAFERRRTWLHKLRRAMVRPGRDCLIGEIEMDRRTPLASEAAGYTPDTPSRRQTTLRTPETSEGNQPRQQDASNSPSPDTIARANVRKGDTHYREKRSHTMRGPTTRSSALNRNGPLPMISLTCAWASSPAQPVPEESIQRLPEINDGRPAAMTTTSFGRSPGPA
jgi:hypothetical protein